MTDDPKPDTAPRPRPPESSHATTLPSPQAPPAVPDPDYQAMEETSFSNILNHLLKKPLSVIHEINHGTKNPLPELLLITLASLGIFGLVLGMFSAGDQLWAAPAKVIGGVLFSAVICLPSLYIFGALGGMDAKLQHTAGLMLTFIAITSLLLVGFAPVVWLFSTSSNSLVFFGFLSLVIWLVCLVFGLRVISRAARSMGGGHGSHLRIWAIIFTLVTLQMTTTLRPIIGESNQFLNLQQKRFFIHHWLDLMTNEGSPKNTRNTPPPQEPQTTPHQEPTNPYLNN